MTEDASFCAELDLVEQDAIETGDRISSTDDPLLGFVAAIAGLGDLRTFVARLEAAAPPSIAPDLAAIHESLDPSTAVLTNPVTAIANALVGGLAVSGSYERVDAYSAQACGRPLFGDVTFRPQSTDIRDQFPREQDDLWYLRSSNFHGERLCDVREQWHVDSDVVLITCGQHVHAVSLPDLALIWSLEVADAPIGAAEADAGLLAVLRTETLPAEGLNPPRWRANLTIIDVLTGEVTADLPMNGDAGVLPVSDAETEKVGFHIDRVMQSGLVLIGYQANSSLDERFGEAGIIAFGSDGAVEWISPGNSISEVADDFNWALAQGPEGEDRILDLVTGELSSEIPDGVPASFFTAYDLCSTGLSLGSRDGQQWFYDPAANEYFAIPSRLVDANSIDHFMTASGILVMSSGEVALVDREGNYVWQLLDDVISRVWWRDGHLVVSNRAGDQFQVDIRTGTEAGPWTWRDDPPFNPPDERWDGWISSRGDTIYTPWEQGPCGEYDS